MLDIIKKNFSNLVKSSGGVLYLDARKSTGSGLPTNSPLTTPWKDLSGRGNNATPTNFAGTTASGVDVSAPIKPFWVLDGTDDFFSLVNTASIDITAAPLAIFATFLVSPDSGINGYLCAKTLDNTTPTVQYGLSYNKSNQRIQVILEGVIRNTTLTNSILANTWYNAGFIWNGVDVRCYINNSISSSASAFTGSLTTKVNISIGRRMGDYFEGNLATLTIYTGAKAAEANILKAEKAISKVYIGG